MLRIIFQYPVMLPLYQSLANEEESILQTGKVQLRNRYCLVMGQLGTYCDAFFSINELFYCTNYASISKLRTLCTQWFLKYSLELTEVHPDFF